jgi:hypothetical protein
MQVMQELCKIRWLFMVVYGCLNSGGYDLIGIIISGFWELNFMKLGNLFHIYGNFSVDKEGDWFQISCQIPNY